jgi:hypothetical protein
MDVVWAALVSGGVGLLTMIVTRLLDIRAEHIRSIDARELEAAKSAASWHREDATRWLADERQAYATWQATARRALHAVAQVRLVLYILSRAADGSGLKSVDEAVGEVDERLSALSNVTLELQENTAAVELLGANTPIARALEALEAIRATAGDFQERNLNFKMHGETERLGSATTTELNDLVAGFAAAANEALRRPSSTR